MEPRMDHINFVKKKQKKIAVNFGFSMFNKPFNKI